MLVDSMCHDLLSNQNVILLITASSRASLLNAIWGLAALRPMAKAKLITPRVFMVKRLKIV